MVLVRLAFVVLFALLGVAHAKVLPIYIEDSHAGSLGFFADTIDLESDCTLLLFDAHSDASAADASDRLRDGMRQVLSSQRRQNLIKKWRDTGVVQPFNWIEPLMPRPFKKVVWVAGKKLTDEELVKLQGEVATHLDWKLQVQHRDCGELASHYVVTDWQRLQAMQFDGDVAVSIDLDLYATKVFAESDLPQHWQYCLSIPRLKALSVAVSRPWLQSDAQAFRLLENALDLALGVRNANVQFEPFRIDQHDRSEKAKELMRHGKRIPRLEMHSAPATLRQLCVQHAARILVQTQQDKWKELLEEWQRAQFGVSIQVDGQQVSVDGVWRMHVERAGDLLINVEALPQKVRWWVIEAQSDVYNIAPEYFVGKAFTGDSAAYISNKKTLLCETHDPALAASAWINALPRSNKSGALRLMAELVYVDRVEFTPEVELRVRDREVFLGSLSEQFGTPYVFGIGKLHARGESGGETLVGNDCANFLVYAWRQQGKLVPWSNPKQLTAHLDFLSGPHQKMDSPKFVPTLIEKGLVVHFGSHVAALWEDRGELGVLDSEDLLVHHLSAIPEVISLGEILGKYHRYHLYTLRGVEKAAQLVFGGDVNLAGVDDPRSIVSEEHRKQMVEADLTYVNLECAFSDVVTPRGRKRFEYVAPSNRVRALKECGVDVVSVANNHSCDAGEKGLETTLSALSHAKLAAVGVFQKEETHGGLVVKEVNGVTVAFVAFNTIETDFEQLEKLEVLSYPAHRELIEGLIRETQADYVIALPHWGKEYTDQVSPQQRELAKWLIRSGADAVVGSHTHYPQRCEYYRGRPIIFSLGNLYFPNQGPKGFNEYCILRLSLCADGKTVAVEW